MARPLTPTPAGITGTQLEIKFPTPKVSQTDPNVNPNKTKS